MLNTHRKGKIIVKLNAPKTSTFWGTIILAAIGLVIFALHSFVFQDVRYIAGIGFLLVLIAFMLLIMDVI
jgi:hypothetical protein